MIDNDDDNNDDDNGNRFMSDDGSLSGWPVAEESNALSSLLRVPTSLLVQMKNEWDISHSTCDKSLNMGNTGKQKNILYLL
jgi:hypothetical protein